MNKVRAFIKNIGKKKPEEPATQEEIEQLKLEAEKAKLKLNIAKAKEAMPKSGLAKFLQPKHVLQERRTYRAKERRTQPKRRYIEPKRDTSLNEHASRISQTFGSNKDRLPHIKRGFGI